MQIDLHQIKNIENQKLRSEMIRRYSYPKASAPYEYFLLYVNWILSAVTLWMIVQDLIKNPRQALWAIALIPAALFVADLMSAGFHKWLDSYADERNIFWGSAARAFRIHHEFPNNLNEVPYLHNVSAFSTMMFMFYSIFAAVIYFSDLNILLSAFIWCLLILFANGTEIHKRSHMRKPGRFFRWMQEWSIFLSAEVHLHHHSNELDSDYGIINGWSNPILKRLRIWQRVDNIVWKYFGMVPRTWR